MPLAHLDKNRYGALVMERKTIKFEWKRPEENRVETGSARLVIPGLGLNISCCWHSWRIPPCQLPATKVRGTTVKQRMK